MKYFIIFVLLLAGCTSSNDFNKAKDQLEQQGYLNVTQTGHQFFCCSDKDTFSTGFEATTAKGKKVKGCICSSYLKGITIRFE